MDGSLFAKFPAELRNRIYSDALQAATTPLWVRNEGNKALLEVSDRNKHPLGLTLTCKTIYHETYLLFFSANTFRIKNHLQNFHLDFSNFKNTIGEAATESLGGLVFELEKATVLTMTDHRRDGPRADHGLREIRRFAMEHPHCKITLLVPVPIDISKTFELDLGDLSSQTWDRAMTMLRAQPEHLHMRNAVELLKRWRTVLGEVQESGDRLDFS